MTFLNNIKTRLTNNVNYRCVVGLRDATKEELSEVKAYLRDTNTKFSHKTKGLPFNGVLKINC